MKFASFDLEIAKEIPPNTTDWKTISPLGISCAALHVDDMTITPELFWSVPQIDQERAEDLVYRLQILEHAGYKIVTWNGCAFDFAVLAQESGMVNECASLALNHIDLMLLVTFQKGYMLGLNKACVGVGLGGKTHEVTLKTGQTITEMSGALAPQMWAAGETDAVLTYLAGDVEQTNALAHIIEQSGLFRWTSNAGKLVLCGIDKMRTVKECFAWPVPDTSWMKNPVTRKQFVDWMPDSVLTKEFPQWEYHIKDVRHE